METEESIEWFLLYRPRASVERRSERSRYPKRFSENGVSWTFENTSPQPSGTTVNCALSLYTRRIGVASGAQVQLPPWREIRTRRPKVPRLDFIAAMNSRRRLTMNPERIVRPTVATQDTTGHKRKHAHKNTAMAAVRSNEKRPKLSTRARCPVPYCSWYACCAARSA